MSQFDDLFPETLFETYSFTGNRVCLVCGSNKAESVLRSIDRELVPLCAACSRDWNFHGYNILKKIKPKQLLQSLLVYKLRHWFSAPSVMALCRSLRDLGDWSAKMKRFMRARERSRRTRLLTGAHSASNLALHPASP
jgi:hypothetical protein